MLLLLLMMVVVVDRKGLFTAHELNWTEPQFANSSVNDCVGMHASTTNRALTVLVLLQPVNTKCSRDAEARDQ